MDAIIHLPQRSCYSQSYYKNIMNCLHILENNNTWSNTTVNSILIIIQFIFINTNTPSADRLLVICDLKYDPKEMVLFINLMLYAWFPSCWVTKNGSGSLIIDYQQYWYQISKLLIRGSILFYVMLARLSNIHDIRYSRSSFHLTLEYAEFLKPAFSTLINRFASRF